MTSIAIRLAACGREAEPAVTLHRPVMLDAALTGLNVRAGGTYVDATYGRGGHSAAILARLAGSGALHAFDQDPEACAHAWREHAGETNFHIHAANFSQLAAITRDAGIYGRVDGILLDLGVSSPQLDDAQRGFSFMRDGALDMRMNPHAGESAAEWLMRADEAEIADVLWRLGEERNSRRIARAIVQARLEAPLTSTAQLAAIVSSVSRGPRQKIHPATRSFQAIRLFINRELEVLEQVLQQALEVLAPGGRLVVISFHSLEDRIVKRFMRGPKKETETAYEARLLALRNEVSAAWPLHVLGREFPSDAECAENPRARSAVLRVAEKLAVHP